MTCDHQDNSGKVFDFRKKKKREKKGKVAIDMLIRL